MTEYPDDYDLDTSEGYIVEDGSTIVGFLMMFLAIGIIAGICKWIGLL